MINNSFYGNENENNDNIINKDEELKIKENFINKDDLIKNKTNKENKDDDILILKTPNKLDLENQENLDENIRRNMDINGIQRNLNILFEQRIYQQFINVKKQS